jgi:hypothetical protein
LILISLQRNQHLPLWLPFTMKTIDCYSQQSQKQCRKALKHKALSCCRGCWTNTMVTCRRRSMLSRCQGTNLGHLSCVIADWHRFTARLLLSAMDEPASDVGELCSMLCAVFKTGMRLTQTQATTPSLTADALLRECKWFEKNAYNAAISHVHVWHLGTVIDLLEYSCLVSLSPQVPKFVSLMIARSSTLKTRCRQYRTTNQIMRSTRNMCRQFFTLY